MNKIGHNHFYLVILPPLIIVWIIAFLLNIDLLLISSFLIAYSWRSIMAFPYLEESIDRRTRYSLVALFFRYEKLMLELLSKIGIPNFINCHIVIILPLSILSLLTLSWFFIAGIIGTLFFDIVLYCYHIALNRLKPL